MQYYYLKLRPLEILRLLLLKTIEGPWFLIRKDFIITS